MPLAYMGAPYKCIWLDRLDKILFLLKVNLVKFPLVQVVVAKPQLIVCIDSMTLILVLVCFFGETFVFFFYNIFFNFFANLFFFEKLFLGQNFFFVFFFGRIFFQFVFIFGGKTLHNCQFDLPGFLRNSKLFLLVKRFFGDKFFFLGQTFLIFLAKLVFDGCVHNFEVSVIVGFHC